MYTVDLKTAKIALDELDKNPDDWEKFLSKLRIKKFYKYKIWTGIIFSILCVPWFRSK